MKRIIPLICLCFLLSGCAASATMPAPSPPVLPTPAIPDSLALNDDGVPTLSVYVLSEEAARDMLIEDYVAGVVAGEMKNDWPMEALKAQAILARTFVLRFVSEKTSRYDSADISTDIVEAQAYNADAVNDRIREAVSATCGKVLCAANGTLPYAWFHAHSGGTTALAREGLGYERPEPSYTKITEGLDSADAPAEAATWEATFSAKAFLAACRQTGVSPDSIDSVTVKDKGPSGRAVTFDVGGTAVDASRLRLALGSTVMRSTLLTSLTSDGKVVRMAGKGYGHGVGMPQWGAYALAKDGFLGEDIAVYYFDGLSIVQLWGDHI